MTVKILRLHSGSSMIEILLFIAILGVVGTVMINLLFQSTETRINQETEAAVEQNIAQIAQQLNDSIRQASNFMAPDDVGDTSAILALQRDECSSDQPTIFALSGGYMVKISRTNVAAISNDQVAVTNLYFRNTSATSTEKSVFVRFTVSRVVRLMAPRTYSRTFEGTFSLYAREPVSCGDCEDILPGCDGAGRYVWTVLDGVVCQTVSTYLDACGSSSSSSNPCGSVSSIASSAATTSSSVATSAATSSAVMTSSSVATSAATSSAVMTSSSVATSAATSSALMTSSSVATSAATSSAIMTSSSVATSAATSSAMMTSSSVATSATTSSAMMTSSSVATSATTSSFGGMPPPMGMFGWRWVERAYAALCWVEVDSEFTVCSVSSTSTSTSSSSAVATSAAISSPCSSVSSAVTSSSVATSAATSSAVMTSSSVATSAATSSPAMTSSSVATSAATSSAMMTSSSVATSAASSSAAMTSSSVITSASSSSAAMTSSSVATSAPPACSGFCSCGDSFCDLNEQYYCACDCGSFCGNGCCDWDENSTTCPGDCGGAFPTACSYVCGI